MFGIDQFEPLLNPLLPFVPLPKFILGMVQLDPLLKPLPLLKPGIEKLFADVSIDAESRAIETMSFFMGKSFSKVL
jgi:hypothetical protein